MTVMWTSLGKRGSQIFSVLFMNRALSKFQSPLTTLTGWNFSQKTLPWLGSRISFGFRAIWPVWGQSDPKSFQAKLTVEFLSVVSECYSKLLLAWTRLTIKKGLCTCHLGHLCNWIINNKTLRQLALLNKQQKNKKKGMCCNKSKPTISLYKNWTTDWLGSIILLKFLETIYHSKLLRYKNLINGTSHQSLKVLPSFQMEALSMASMAIKT